MMLNNIVKGMPEGDGSRDERYNRIRSQALEIMKKRIAELEAA
jgi:hypothetical protein